MWKHLIAIACATPLLMAQAPMSYPDCEARLQRTDWSDPDAPVQVFESRIRPGKSCQIRYDMSAGPTQVGRIIIGEMQIHDGPFHGKAKQRGKRIVYTADADYRGADAFHYSLYIERSGEKGYLNILMMFNIR